uniref:ER membrane protein complex subunit 4 n=1 Tax=Cyclophora tenuis TaxID=216820 RepID=A0A7S1CWV8_CYCTE|mmetsp:Transcript_11496/g.19481  ORF Transcript_11496/g.19481 Transcript_11496/m.19481 type:complete len:185 (+) Transcript_11496:37-591(+)
MAPQQSFSIDLVLKENHKGYDLLHKCPPLVGMKGVQTVERQHGVGGTGGSNTTMTQQQKNLLAQKKKNKAMSLATGPGQQILMNAFMMYMSGKQLNIFSISVTSMAILNPIRGILSMEQTFGALEGVDLQVPKLIFVGLNLAWFAVGLYKMSSMRLLPTTSADWTGSIVWKEMMETSSIPPTGF